MNKFYAIFALAMLSGTITYAQEGCLEQHRLLSLDAQWEKALLESDVSFLESILAKDFIWVHNHASGIDTREALLQRAADRQSGGASGNPRSRKSNNVQAIVLGSTGVVTGYTIVDRGPTPTNYHFMRTYVDVGGKCVLLANHTMAVPDSED
mgnify:CR=1 FL=1